jgi:hypothetical protein
MIRYEISLERLEGRIEFLAPGWLRAAEKKTEVFRKDRKYSEKEGAWSAIKQVYIDLQCGKCAYCERQFGSDEKSRIEHDVEHFRPKSSVKVWPPASGDLKYDFSTGAGSATGYHLLAYNILNYMVSCKKCNSPYKSDHFPIAGAKRLLNTDDFAKLRREQPLLIYPISNVDRDPEVLITFEGLLPVPKYAKGHLYRRARVTIDFFGLARREELLRERAVILKALYVACEDVNHEDPLRRRDARQTLDLAAQPGLPHRNCARAFCDLYSRVPATARQYYESAIEYLESLQSPKRGVTRPNSSLPRPSRPSHPAR